MYLRLPIRFGSGKNRCSFLNISGTLSCKARNWTSQFKRLAWTPFLFGEPQLTVAKTRRKNAYQKNVMHEAVASVCEESPTLRVSHQIAPPVCMLALWKWFWCWLSISLAWSFLDYCCHIHDAAWGLASKLLGSGCSAACSFALEGSLRASSVCHLQLVCCSCWLWPFLSCFQKFVGSLNGRYILPLSTVLTVKHLFTLTYSGMFFQGRPSKA